MKYDIRDNPIKIELMPAKIFNGTKIQQAIITVSKKLSNMRVYIENNTEPNVILGIRKKWGRFQYHSKHNPLLIGDMKKGDSRNIWTKIQIKNWNPMMCARIIDMDIGIDGDIQLLKGDKVIVK